MKLDEIKTLAIRQFSKITGLDEEKLRKSIVNFCVDADYEWIEFNHAENFFHYNKKRNAVPRRFRS